MTRRLVIRAAVLGLLGAAVVSGNGASQSKSAMIELCGAEARDAYGDVDVTFGKIRREENRNYAYGEILMADGTARRVRCKITRGKVRGLMFRNEGGGLGYRWTSDVPEGGFLLPDAEPEADAEAPVDAEDRIPTEAPSDGETEAQADLDVEPEEPTAPLRPRFKRVPQ